LRPTCEVQKYGREPISLHTPLGEDGDSEFGDLIEDSEAIQPAEAVLFTLLQEQLHLVNTGISVTATLGARSLAIGSATWSSSTSQRKNCCKERYCW
jgi:RNA polymerase primary sigma factor